MKENTLSFKITEDDKLVEVIKITKDKFYWKGEEVDDKYQVYERFNEWLNNVEVK